MAMFGLSCCCKRGPSLAAAGSGPKGGADTSNEATPIVFRQAQPVVEAESYEDRIKREQLVIAQVFLRGTVFNLVDKQFFHLGTRPCEQKSCFLLNDPYGPRKIMALLDVPTDCPLPLYSSSGKLRLQRTMLGLKFPFVLPTVSAEYLADKKKVVVVRVLSPDSTLRRMVYGREDGAGGDGDVGNPLSLDVAACLGRQILEAICFLRWKGISTTHLHVGNIFVDTDTNTCALSDYENGLLGLPVLLSAFVSSATAHLKTARPGLVPDVDVLCFYHVLHEMMLGYPPGGSPNSDDPLRVPPTCPRNVQQILKAILKGTIQNPVHLLECPLFAESPIPDHVTNFSSFKAKLSERMDGAGV